MEILDTYFIDLISEHNDFDEIDGCECAIAIPCNRTGDNKRYTLCLIWKALIKLKGLLDNAADAELRANGLERIKNTVEATNEVLYEGDTVKQSTLADMGVTATSIIFSYKEWKEKRERLLQGKAGAFYDFEELTVIIKNICVLLNVTTYNDLYAFLNNMLWKYNGKENVITDPFVVWLDSCKLELQTVPVIESGKSLFNFGEKQTAIQQLEVWYNNSKSDRIYALAFIYYKLGYMAAVEHEILSFKQETFKRCDN